MEDNFSMKKLITDIRQDVIQYANKHHFNLKMMKPKGKVLIPKKLGRENPKFIKTDNFNLAQTLDTINTVASTVQQVSNTVQQVNAAVSTKSNTIQATVHTPPSNTNPLLNAGYNFLQNNNPLINNGYNTNTKITGQSPMVLQPELKFDTNTLLISGGILVIVIVLVLVNRK